MTDTAELKPVAWRARRYGSSEWEVFGYDPRALKQFSFFEPLYSADALSSLVREMDEAKSIAASAQANVFRLVAAGRDDLELMKETAATVQSLIARATAAEADAARMREALEPSTATKAAYIGEFTIAVERIVNEDEEPVDDGADAPDPYDHIQVPWTTIKQIMAAIRARALSNTSEGGKDE